MLEQAFIRDQLELLLSKEQQAAKSYGKLAIDLSNPKVREQIEQLRQEKLKHVRLTERMLEIID